MTRIVITVDSATLTEMIARLDPRRALMALSVAVNDTARQTKLKARQEVSRESSLPSRRVGRGISISPYSTPETLSAAIVGSGKPVPLDEFGARQTRKGVSARVWGRRQMYPGAFIVEGYGGAVYHRVSPERFPIKRMWGAGIAQVMAQDNVSAVIVEHGTRRLQANAQRQLDRYLAGAGGRNR